MEELFNKLEELIQLLDQRSSLSVDFFKSIKKNLEKNNRNLEELDSLIKCYAITQYANFSKTEEDVLNQIINFAREYKKRI